jgi:hypothetical protein
MKTMTVASSAVTDITNPSGDGRTWLISFNLGSSYIAE